MSNIIERKKDTPTTRTQLCPECNTRFNFTRNNRIYCSTKCKFRAWAKLHPRVKTILPLLIVTISIFICSTLHADTIDDLIPIIIQAESSGNPNASDGHSYGLMGISPCVVEEYCNFLCGTCVDNPPCKRCSEYSKNIDLFNPDENKWIGEWYLRKIQSWLPEEYKNSKKHLIAGYNCGIGWLKEHNYQPPKSHKNKIYDKIYKEDL